MGSYRQQFKFWLNLERDSEYAIAEIIANLKHQRQFSAAIRDGLRLLWDLRAGKTDVLCELFPWIKEAFADTSHPPATNGGGDLRREIELLKQAVLSQNTPSGLINAPAGAPKAMAVPTFTTPALDDLGSDDLVLKKDTSTDAGKNFINSMMALQA